MSLDKETLEHIKNILRRGTITWYRRTQCVNRTRIQKNIGFLKNGKQKLKWFYYCDKCQREFDSPDSLEVDHIKEIGPFDGDFNTFIERMYCPLDNLQNLCSECHQRKTSNFNSTLKYIRKIKFTDL